jgi:phenylacetate-CoA ligase
VVPSGNFGPKDEAEIERRVKQRLGEVEVVVEAVASIPRTRAGKFKAVISLVKEGRAEVSA